MDDFYNNIFWKPALKIFNKQSLIYKSIISFQRSKKPIPKSYKDIVGRIKEHGHFELDKFEYSKILKKLECLGVIKILKDEIKVVEKHNFEENNSCEKTQPKLSKNTTKVVKKHNSELSKNTTFSSANNNSTKTVTKTNSNSQPEVLKIFDLWLKSFPTSLRTSELKNKAKNSIAKMIKEHGFDDVFAVVQIVILAKQKSFSEEFKYCPRSKSLWELATSTAFERTKIFIANLKNDQKRKDVIFL